MIFRPTKIKKYHKRASFTLKTICYTNNYPAENKVFTFKKPIKGSLVHLYRVQANHKQKILFPTSIMNHFNI